MESTKVQIVFADKLEIDRKIYYELAKDDKVGDLKHQIIENYPKEHPAPSADRQLLIYRGRVLDDQITIKSVLGNDDMEGQQPGPPAVFHLAVKPSRDNESANARPITTGRTSASFTSTASSAAATSSSSSSASTNTSTTAATTSSTPTPTNNNANTTTAYPVNSANDSLHTMNLTISNGKNISIPCYDYMFVPTQTEGEYAFCISPSALMKLSSLGVNVDIPPLFSAPQPPQVDGSNEATQQRQVTVRERFDQIVSFARRGYRPLLLCIRLVVFLRLFGMEIENKLQLALIAVALFGVILYQSNVLQPYYNQIMENVPGLHTQLPHIHPEVPNEQQEDNNVLPERADHQQQRQRLLGAGVVMFLSSLIPNLHENWVEEDQRRADHVQALRRRIEEQQQAEEEEEARNREGNNDNKTVLEQEEGEDESTYFDPPVTANPTNTLENE